MTGKLNYKDYIVSDKDHCTFLHRTFRDCVPSILEKGLQSGTDIRSSTTWQPQELEKAIGIYDQGRDYGNSVIVIKIPRQLWESVRLDPEYRGDEVMHPSIGYFSDSLKFTVKPEFVKAWIDRDTNEVHLKEDENERR